MKKYIHHPLTETPLLARVVSLYAILGLAVGMYIYSSPVLASQPVSVYVPAVKAVSREQPIKPEEIIGTPISIELPRIGLVREVIDGEYDTASGQWTLADDKAHYAVITNLSNNLSGQTVIYGHNTMAVLEPVKSVQAGDELLVTADNGHVFVYTYSNDRFVDPTDVSVMYETSVKPRLVLMTCEGWLSETRRLLYFDFKGVQ